MTWTWFVLVPLRVGTPKKVDPVSLSVYIRNRNELYTVDVDSALAQLYF